MIRSIVLLLVIPAFVFGDCTRRAVKQPQKVVLQRVVVHRDYHHYYSLDPYYQQQALATEIVKQLRAEIKPGFKNQVEPGPAPKEDSGDPVAGKYQNEKLLAVVNNGCTKCHGAASKQTRFVTKDGKALADVPAGKVWEAFGLVNSGEMPKASDSLGDEPVKMFYEWAKQARKQ